MKGDAINIKIRTRDGEKVTLCENDGWHSTGKRPKGTHETKSSLAWEAGSWGSALNWRMGG